VSSLEQFIADKLSSRHCRFSSIGGGSINDTYRIQSDRLTFFCKLNLVKKFPGLFEKEKKGLEFLRSTHTIRIPEVVWCGEFESYQVLILEWIEQGLRTENFWKKFGEGLAALHRSDAWVWNDQLWSDRDRRTACFGFHENNYMGALPQDNTPSTNWVEFFVKKRLQPQIELALNGRLLGNNEVELFEKLYYKLSSVFPEEKPAALHGDLWSGNYLCSGSSEPVLIDPAVYYGHRSVDLGMTRLFGGFDDTFYESYDYHFPLPQNADEQHEICNLYPLLIHLNLFGSGYLRSIVSILKKYQ